MRIIFYLNYLLLLARSREEAGVQTKTLVTHLSYLDLSLNWEKSSIIPFQLIVYLGMELNLITMTTYLLQLRRDSLMSLLQHVKNHRSGSLVNHVPVGHDVSSAHGGLLGLLHMRRLQRWFNRLRINPVHHKRSMISIPVSRGRPESLEKSPDSLDGELY